MPEAAFVRRFEITEVEKDCELLFIPFNCINLVCKIGIYQGRALLHSSHLCFLKKVLSATLIPISIKVVLRPYRLLN